MSETVLFSFLGLRLITVATMGYPLWYLRLRNPRRAYGLVAEIGTPWGDYELRVNVTISDNQLLND